MKSPIEVVTQLFVSTDARDWSRVKHCFHSEVLMDYSSMNGNPATLQSPEEIVRAWKGILPGFNATHHQLGNFIESIQDITAQVFCYGTASHFLKNEQGNIWTVVGSYEFKLLPQDSKSWKINAMKFNFKYQEGNLNLPEKAMKNLK